MKDIVKIVCGGIGGVVGWLFGDLNGFFYAIVAFMTLDYITGVLKAIKTKTLNSNTGAWGIIRKVLTLSVIAVAHILDVQVIGGGGALTTATELFFIANEGISLLENLGELGVTIPKKVIDVLEQLKKDNGTDN